jgi:hypothetical protein
MQQEITTQNVFAFAQIIEAIQPWMVADDSLNEFYTSVGAVLDNVLGSNIIALQALRNPDIQNELLLRLMARLLGFEWKQAGTLDEDIIQLICQNITSYYSRNGSGSMFIKPPIDGSTPTDFVDSATFINTQTTSRIVSFILGTSIAVEQLWTKDYTTFYSTQEVRDLLGSFTYNDTVYSKMAGSNSKYRGMWDASTNVPYLVNGVGIQGDYYYCNVAGAVDFGNGLIDFNFGDQVGYTADDTWQKSEAGLWYLSPHVALSSVDSNTSINFLELIDLFYYLAPVTMVISIIKQRYFGDVKLYYNLNQVSTYKLKYVSSVEFGLMSGTAKLYYNVDQVSSYKLKYRASAV